MSSKVPLASWVEAVGLSDRSAPDLFTSSSEVLGRPFGPEMRLGFDALGLAGYFCVGQVPAAAFLRLQAPDDDRIETTCRALWNQGLASVLLVILPDTVQVHSLVRAPRAQPLDRLIETLDLAADAFAAARFMEGIESGRVFRDPKYAEKFVDNERIDDCLLDNLHQALASLIKCNLSVSQAQALLMQVMFVAYLEDREAIDETYFIEACGVRSGVRSLHDLLAKQQPEIVGKLFRQLKKDFNGHVFIAPGVFTRDEAPALLTAEHLSLLADFRDGHWHLGTKQGRLWPYQFRFIPVELISAVYDRFLGFDPQNKRDQGEYYTPAFLADFTVGQLLELHPEHADVSRPTSVLDPACGSGIFLVRLYQRRVEEWRLRHGGRRPSWKRLLAILGNIHGADINPNAIRVAVFSLYVALLEQVHPHDLRTLRLRGEQLPELLGVTLRVGDYFRTPTDEKYDLIIGNPPWVSRKGEIASAAEQWCKSNKYPMPAKQVAWAFVWKALQHIKPNGGLAMVLPGMTFLVSESSASARNRLFTDCKIERVINLGDLRFLLFPGARHPTALLLGCAEPNHGPVSYGFDYLTPKAESMLSEQRVIVPSRLDRTRLTTSQLIAEPRRFGLDLWMRSPDRRLFQWLDALPKLSLLADSTDPARAWKIGEGFQPANDSAVSKGKYIPKHSRFVAQLPFVAVESLQRFVISSLPNNIYPSPLVRRTGLERGYHGARVLVAEGIEERTSRARASYIDMPAVFNESLFVICGPSGDEERLILCAALLNSRLFSWFFLHSGTFIGMERPKLLQAQIRELPFPEPKDLDDHARAADALKKIVARFREWKKMGAVPAGSETIVDKLIYEYFGLSSQEIALVEDTAEFVLPSLQPKRDFLPPLYAQACSKDFSAYADALTTRLLEWFEPNSGVAAEVVGYDEDAVVLRLCLTEQKDTGFSVNTGTDGLRKALARLRRTLTARSLSSNLMQIPDARIFIDGDLYLIKPRVRRHWLRSTAQADADNIAGDLLLAQRSVGVPTDA